MLTISLNLPEVLKTPNASVINFDNWKSFYKYFYKECESKERKFNMIIASLAIRTRKAGSVVKASKDAGYWIVELAERD